MVDGGKKAPKQGLAVSKKFLLAEEKLGHLRERCERVCVVYKCDSLVAACFAAEIRDPLLLLALLL